METTHEKLLLGQSPDHLLDRPSTAKLGGSEIGFPAWRYGSRCSRRRSHACESTPRYALSLRDAPVRQSAAKASQETPPKAFPTGPARLDSRNEIAGRVHSHERPQPMGFPTIGSPAVKSTGWCRAGWNRFACETKPAGLLPRNPHPGFAKNQATQGRLPSEGKLCRCVGSAKESPRF